MANPRQRAKARSHKSTKPSHASKRRLHHKLRKAPHLKGPEVLQQGWDRKKTVFQKSVRPKIALAWLGDRRADAWISYAALGLMPSIPLPSGPGPSRPRAEGDNSVKVGYGRIVRDDDGNVVDVIIPEDEADREEGVDEDMEDDEQFEGVGGKTDVVRSLEELSKSFTPVKRYASTSEWTWLHSLVKKYGDDTGAMARDRGVNVWQKTEGEIRRMIRKAGGVVGLQTGLR